MPTIVTVECDRISGAFLSAANSNHFMKANRSTRRVALFFFLLAAGLSRAWAESPSRDDDIQALREQIRLLDQKLRVLERKSELKDEETAAAAKTAPRVTVNDKGVTLASADGVRCVGPGDPVSHRERVRPDRADHDSDAQTAGGAQPLIRRG